MITGRSWRIAGLVWLTLGLVWPVAAGEPRRTAQVIAASGDLWLKRQASPVWDRIAPTPASPSLLHEGDALLVGANSVATLLLTSPLGRSTAELSPGTHFVYRATAEDVSVFGRLVRGMLHLFRRERGPGGIETPTGTAASEGTEILVAVKEDDSTEIFCIEGLVRFSNPQGGASLRALERSSAVLGGAPTTPEPITVEAVNDAIQWCLYYPAVIDPREIPLSEEERVRLAESLAAYQKGDLINALGLHPRLEEPGSAAERIYSAALLLAVGRVDAVERMLGPLGTPTEDGDERVARLANALRTVIAAVKHRERPDPPPPELASEWLAWSYYAQSRTELEKARSAAQQAEARAPGFGFAAIRRAELEFGFGYTQSAKRAVDRGLLLSPEHAEGWVLRGFIAASENRTRLALECFDQALACQASLANAWLGRGLVKIRKNRLAEGLQDLEIAAALEPQRALLRSYLAKGYAEGAPGLAEREFARAKELDPGDPTAWLYLALYNQRRNRINEAIADLDESIEKNENRALYRSRLLLDQDRAVRAANLARVYQEAGMAEVALLEASRAVSYDYASPSAHLFLANSYDVLRDPRQIHLRYETPWFNELLVANLLAPVGMGNLSQNISQQEYSRLFEREGVGLSSRTEYFSRGRWRQVGSHYGAYGNTGYALDVDYLSDPGQRPNEDLEDLALWLKVKQQITPQDGLLLWANLHDYESGDVRPYYDPDQAARGLRVSERQAPNLFAGYHRAWQPGHHTLALVGYLDDRLTLDAPQTGSWVFGTNRAGDPIAFPAPAQWSYRRELAVFSGEGQQVATVGAHTLVAGGRLQIGAARVKSSDLSGPDIFIEWPGNQSLEENLVQGSIYLYDYWKLDNLVKATEVQVTLGLAYDTLRWPLNSELAPLQPGGQTTDQWSPKAGLLWSLSPGTSLRASWGRSLRGAYHERSLRLEPSVVGGLNQAYRSIAPESVSDLAGGQWPGAEQTVWGLAFGHRLMSRTWLTLSGQVLEEAGSRYFGAFSTSAWTSEAAVPEPYEQELRYREQSVGIALDQLLGEYWSLGIRYRLVTADLESRFPSLPEALSQTTGEDFNGTLHHLALRAHVNLPTGLFGSLEAHGWQQSNAGYTPDRPGDAFWHIDLFLGYRFPRRHAEVRVGILNVTDRDYRLNPLNLHPYLPRERTFTCQLRLDF